MNDKVDGNPDVLAQEGNDNKQAEAKPESAASADAGQQPADEAQAYQPEDVSNLSSEPSAGTGGDVNLAAILDIPVKVTVEIGRTQVPVSDLMQYNPGSVVELDRLVGEPLDVLINGTLVARGEVVVVNDKFGVRLTDVVSPASRFQSMQ
ncbi:flagellar motor switch protein FliN [Porticoccus sp. W117]|uniref:flagellar motor switch protein FliN n=1 Tax=Porticoccus sp. W117 TaxID=3054777 RepID=UPI002593A9A1|nr:flagellar motor switch protein FliN [Porticoccus sp. W117]MDM3870983.1 flagellar motor switch protein FliN [Porticoccus sp. W117]